MHEKTEKYKYWSILDEISLLLFLCIELSIRTKWNLILFVITIIACASLVFFSLIEHKNRPISEREKKYIKKTK